MSESTVLKILAGLASQSTDQDSVSTLKQNHVLASRAFKVGTPEAFETINFALDDETAAILVEVLISFHMQTGDFADIDDLRPSLQQAGITDDKITEVLALMSRVFTLQLTSHGVFSVWLERSLDFAGRVSLSDDLITAMQILESGTVVEDVRLSGTADCCAYLETKISDKRSSVDSSIAHRGDVREEVDEILGEIDSARRGEATGVVLSGFRAIDNRTNGFNYGDLVLVGASTAEGKCVKKGSLVFDPEAGSYRRIGEESIGSIAGLKSTEICSGTYTKVISSGHKECLEIKTNLGSVAETSIFHKFLTQAGYVEAKDLKVGDLVACSVKVPFVEVDSDDYSVNDSKILGFMVGDGSTGDRRGQSLGLHVNLNETGIISEFIKCLKILGIPDKFIDFSKRQSHGAGFIKVLHSKVYNDLPESWRNDKNRKISPFLSLMRRADFTGLTPHTKHIPKPVWKFNEFKLKNFLACMWVTDGHFVLSKDSDYEVGYTTVSKRLAYDLKLLCLKLGIVLRCRERLVKLTGTDKKFKAYALTAANAESAIKICRLPIPEKQSKALKIIDLLDNNTKVASDHFPIKIWETIKDEWIKAGSPRGLLVGSAKKNVAADEFGPLKLNRARPVTRTTLRRWASLTDSTVLKDLAEADFHWERITLLKRSGSHECFDIINSSVDNNFLVSNFVTHNSQLCHNIAYNVSHLYKKNVLIITLETSRSIYRRRLFTRHTHNFIRGGVQYNNIKSGELSEKEAKAVLQAAESWRESDSGIIEVVKLSIPSVKDIAAEVQFFNAKHDKPVDVLVVDYLKLMRASRPRGSRREEVEQILEESKQLAGSVNSGFGTVLIAAHQMKTEARERAKPEQGKFYTIRDFADTSEAGKSADRAIAILRTDELKQEHELAACVVKDRDSAVQDLFKLFESFETSLIGSLTEDEEIE